MDIITELVRVMNLAEMDFAISPTTENREKLTAARAAYKEACQPSIVRMLEVEPVKDEFDFVEDENGCIWIVKQLTKESFASQTALAWMCQVQQKDISNILRKNSDCPKALLDLDLSNIRKITNPNGGREIIAIPASICWKILYYYANVARGAKLRSQAKRLCEAMGEAGSSIFIAKQAGFEFEMTNGKLTDELMDLKRRLTKLENQSLPGYSQNTLNQYGETPKQAYFRKRNEWSEMWSAIRNWKKKD